VPAAVSGGEIGVGLFLRERALVSAFCFAGALASCAARVDAFAGFFAFDFSTLVFADFFAIGRATFFFAGCVDFLATDRATFFFAGFAAFFAIDLATLFFADFALFFFATSAFVLVFAAAVSGARLRRRLADRGRSSAREPSIARCWRGASIDIKTSDQLAT
jgi:hypothetical protein